MCLSFLCPQCQTLLRAEKTPAKCWYCGHGVVEFQLRRPQLGQLVVRHPNYRPSTQLGRFDATLDLPRGEFRVVVRMHLRYGDNKWPLTGHEGAPPQHHAVDLTDTFFRQAKAQIEGAWNDRFRLRLRRSGLVDQALRVMIEVVRSEAAFAHFDVEVEDSSPSWSGQAVVTEAPARDGVGDHASFSNDVVSPTGSEYKHETAVKDLVNGHYIAFAMNDRATTTKTPMDVLLATKTQGQPWDVEDYDHWRQDEKDRAEARGVAELQGLVRQLRLVTHGCDVRDLELLVTIHAALSRYGSLIEHVFDTIAGCGVHHRVIHTFLASNDTTRAVHVRLRCRTRAVDEFEHQWPTIVALTQKTSLLTQREAQVTIVHEFGHMLGLPDEYLNLTELAVKALRARASTSAGYLPTEGLIVEQTPKTGTTRDNPTTAANQVSFLRLCWTANLAPPSFGHNTPSLMSVGMDLRLHHGLPFWECLRYLTSEFLADEDCTLELSK